MVAGIDKYPDLSRRMKSELRSLGTSCTRCQTSGVVKKYQALVAVRAKRDRATK